MVYRKYVLVRCREKDYSNCLITMMKASLKREYKNLRVYTKLGVSFRIWKKKGLYF